MMFLIILKDSRFTFLIPKKQEDLYSLIDYNMMMIGGQDCGPLLDDIAKMIMYNIVLGMELLHNQSIIYRDVKASHILLYKYREEINLKYFVTNYESSVGIIRTSSFRTREILQACKDKTIY